MDNERIKAALIRAENIICADCEPEKRIPCLKYAECESIRELRECILEIEKPKQYYPFGMEPQSKTCISCKDQYTCDLPMHCEGKQYKPIKKIKLDSGLVEIFRRKREAKSEGAKNTEQANQPDSQYDLGGLILPGSMWAEPK